MCSSIDLSARKLENIYEREEKKIDRRPRITLIYYTYIVWTAYYGCTSMKPHWPISVPYNFGLYSRLRFELHMEYMRLCARWIITFSKFELKSILDWRLARSFHLPHWAWRDSFYSFLLLVPSHRFVFYLTYVAFYIHLNFTWYVYVVHVAPSISTLGECIFWIKPIKY